MLACFLNSRRGGTISFSTSGGAAIIRERHLIERMQYAKLLVMNRVYARSSCYLHHNIIYIATIGTGI